MELRAGYKQTEVGVIPEEWDVKEIGSGIDLLTGHPFSSSGYDTVGVRLLRGANVKRGVTDWDEALTRYWPSINSDVSRYELRAGDLVISMDGSLVGRSFAQLHAGDLPALLVQRVARIRSSGIDVEFLTAFVGSDNFVHYVDAVKTVTAIPHISPSDIRRFTIPVPRSLAEQRAIASALSDVDALLEGLTRLIAKKRDLKQAAMQQLLTGQTRLPGFHGDWEVKRLGDHVEFLRNGTNSRAELTGDGAVKYLHYGDIHGSANASLSPDALPSLPSPKARSLCRLLDGDLVLADASEDLSGIGKSVEIRDVKERDVVAGLHTIAARFDTRVLTNGFKAYLQFHPAFANQLRRLAAGTKVYATTRSHVGSVEISLPKIDEQAAIATVILDMDTELTALEARREKTVALKQAMMQELLTGRTRLV